MAIQLSVAVRNARLDAIESTTGTSAILKILSGVLIPANCAATETGTVLATVNLPSDWMTAAASGSKSKSGTWTDSSADNTGQATYFRVYDSTGTTCHIQGVISVNGAGGDMIVDNPNFYAGQAFIINTFTLTDANA